MNRAELLEKLELVEPALAEGNLIPIMQHFWFTGTQLMAYNDQIAISTPFETEFVGAVPGGTITALLKASRAKEVEVTPDGDNLAIKAAGARLRLPLLPPEQFVFEMPAPPNNAGMIGKKDRKGLVDALSSCLMSVSNDTSVPDQLGVTVIPDGGALLFYATNYSTLTHARLPVPDAGARLKQRVILSKPFVQQVVKMLKADVDAKLYINEDSALLVVPDGKDETMVFGRLILSDDPIDFQRLVLRMVPENPHKLLTEIPSKMKLILDRAVVITESKVDHNTTSITVHDGEITFDSRSDKGEVIDKMEAGEKQFDVKLKLDAKLLRTGAENFDQYLFADRCAVMMRGETLYMVASK